MVDNLDKSDLPYRSENLRLLSCKLGSELVCYVFESLLYGALTKNREALAFTDIICDRKVKNT